jgi:AraC-like DNA-binding protein
MDKIFLLSNNKKIYYHLRDIFSHKYCLKYFSGAIPEIERNKLPKFIIMTCDYECNFKRCATRFLYLIANKNSFVMIRPIYFMSKMTDLYVAFTPKHDLIEINIIDLLKSSKYYACSNFHLINRRSTFFKITMVQKIIIEYPSPRYSLNKLAETIGVSKSWLSTNFRNIVGINLSKYISRIKMCMLLWQILTTDQPIKWISYSLGYNPMSLSSLDFHGQLFA